MHVVRCRDDAGVKGLGSIEQLSPIGEGGRLGIPVRGPAKVGRRFIDIAEGNDVGMWAGGSVVEVRKAFATDADRGDP